MTVWNATVNITSTSSSIEGAKRIRAASVAVSSQSSDVQFAVKEAAGQGSTTILVSSNLGIRTGSTYQVTITNTYIPNPSQSLEYSVNPGLGLNIISQSVLSIQSDTSISANVIAINSLIFNIRAVSNITVVPFYIKGELAPGTGQFQTSNIYLGAGERGMVTTARIFPQRWSDFSGLMAGFRLYSGDRDSVAVILQDPQYSEDTIQIQIIEPFTDLIMTIGNWHLDIPEGTSFNEPQYTPNYFRSSDILSATMKDFKKFVVEPVQYQTERMRDFRKWDRLDPLFLGPLAKTMGMNIRLDRMDREARRRAVHEWIGFTQYAGTKAFIDFEGYSIDTIFTIEHLWTNDYKNFIVKDPNITYPAYYPTNHVALRYDANVWDISNIEDLRYIYETFYQLASVPLVLDYIYTLVQDQTQLWIQAIDHELEHAPIESTDLPPSFWIIAVEADVLWAPIEGNVFPPNFFIAAVESDVDFVYEYVIYGTIEVPDYS